MDKKKEFFKLFFNSSKEYNYETNFELKSGKFISVKEIYIDNLEEIRYISHSSNKSNFEKNKPSIDYCEKQIQEVEPDIKDYFKDIKNFNKLVKYSILFNQIVSDINGHLLNDNSVIIGCDCGCGGDTITEYDYKELEMLENKKERLLKKVLKLLEG